MIPITELRKRYELALDEKDESRANLYDMLISAQDYLLGRIATRADRMRLVQKALHTELNAMADKELRPNVQQPPWYTEQCHFIDTEAIDIQVLREEYDKLEQLTVDRSQKM